MILAKVIRLLVRFRSAVTGRFVTRKFAEQNTRETVAERVRK